MTHSDTELREQLDLLISAFEHGYNTDLHNGVVKSLEALITAKLTEARIDERNRVEYEIESFEKEVVKGRVSNIYQWFRETLLDAHRRRVATLQSQETQQ